MGTESRVAVVVVTYNSADVIAECLASIPDALLGVSTAGVCVVDNGSTDGTVDLARQAALDVEVLATGANIGYAAAINRALAASPNHDYLLILNPDTVVSAGLVQRLIAGLPADAGIAVPRMESPNGQLAWSLRREPSLRTAVGEAILGGGRAARIGWGELIVDPRAYRTAGPVDWATGAALVISRACEERVGAWDESFLLYSEETDYMLRARDAGLQAWFVPDAKVSHRGGDSHTSPFLWSLLMINRYRLFARRHGIVSAQLYRGILLAGEAVRAVAGRRSSRAATMLLARPSKAPTQLPS